ncbi:MAG TPA: TetR/AcrR family transcriptional regulator [Trebonia sp.]|nr:TetR/AcrR family transcriptional regulator [Trebonia sp.]
MAGTRARASQTARERARAEMTREIKEEARRQLAVTGADGLSLRAVARALGMVSSALYRYYPSRDDLLTALIIDAYDALGEAAEQAVASRAGADADGGSAGAGSANGAGAAAGAAGGAAAGAGGAAGAGAAGGAGARARWIAACYAIRAWARANPHEYALIYGSPVPGYRAPQATVGPASRVPLAFVSLLASAAASGELAIAEPVPGAPVPGAPANGAAADAVSGLGAAAADGKGGGGMTGGGDGGWAKFLPVNGQLAVQAASLAAALRTPEIPADALVRAVIAWTQLFGMISFELFGQFVGSFDPPDALFAHAVTQLAAFVGLR